MKYIKSILIIILSSIIIVSCSKDDGGNDMPSPTPVTPDTPSEKTDYPTFDAPNWSVENQNAFEVSMTGIIELPDSLVKSETSSDKLSVFASSECRGVAERIKLDTGKYVWMVMIMGNESDNNTLSLQIRYWSSSSKHIYHSSGDIIFAADTKIGSIDKPYEPGMNIRTN